ncbi:hypothetical protein D3C76_695970 [compost metagenome]
MSIKKRSIENAAVNSDISQSQAATAVTPSATPTLGVNSNPSATTTPSAPAITAVFDNVGESVGLRGNNSSTDDTRPTLQGIAEPNSVVTIRDNGVVLGSAEANAFGEWSFTPLTDLTPGDYNLRVSDSFDQLSELFVLRVLAPGEAAPEVGITFYLDDSGAQQGYFHNNSSTDDARPTFGGVAQANAVVTIYEGEQIIGSTQADARGNWQFTPTNDLSAGAHSFTVTDASGQRSDTFNVQILDPTQAPDPRPGIHSAIDNAGPSQGNLGNGASTDDNLPVLSGHGKPDSVLNVYAGGTYQGWVNVDGSGNWSFSFIQPLPEGNQILTVVDTANGLTSADFNLHIEPSPALPAAPSIESVFDNVGTSQGNLFNGASTDDLRPQLLGKGQPNSEIHILDNGSYLNSVKVDSNGNWSLSLFKDLSGGTHSFTVVNAAGQSGPAFELNIAVATAPAPSIVTVQDNVGGEQAFLASGATTDDARPGLYGEGRPNSVITIYDGEQVIGSTTSDFNGNWYFSPRADLSLGDHHFVAVDSTGERSETFSLTVEAQAPFISHFADNVGSETGFFGDGDTTDDARPTFGGNGIPDSLITFYSDDQVIGSTQTLANGQWQFTPAEPLNEGNHSISAISANGLVSNTFELTVTPLTKANGLLGLTLSDVLSDTGEHFFVSAVPEVSSAFSAEALEFDAQSFALDSALSSTPATDYGVVVQASLTMADLMEQVQPH